MVARPASRSRWVPLINHDQVELCLLLALSCCDPRRQRHGQGLRLGARLRQDALSGTARTYGFRRDDVDYVAFCFANPAHAEQFRERFDGERVS